MSDNRKPGIFFILCVLVCVALSGYAYTRMKPTPKPVAGLPASFQKLQKGMSQAQVLAMVGQPMSKKVNKQYVNKTPQEWAAIEAKSDAYDAENSSPDAAPNLENLKVGALLPHRVKEVWRYQPNSLIFVTLNFDGQYKLLDWGSGLLAQPRK